eukprot:3939102-Rhodomonas_salina.2
MFNQVPTYISLACSHLCYVGTGHRIARAKFLTLHICFLPPYSSATPCPVLTPSMMRPGYEAGLQSRGRRKAYGAASGREFLRKSRIAVVKVASLQSSYALARRCPVLMTEAFPIVLRIRRAMAGTDTGSTYRPRHTLCDARC